MRALIVVPLVVVLVWATISYSVWMLRPTSLSWSVNSVEWVRYNVPFGIGNWAADHVEQAYYSNQAPKKGGPQLKSLPKVGAKQRHHGPSDGSMAAGDHSDFLQPATWRGDLAAAGPSVDGAAPVLVTTYRPDPNYPQIVAYVAWFDHTRTELA